jgi:phage terminase small subunit
MALRPKQQRFVEEYLIDLNATQAAIRAGYSPRTAGSIGDENLKKPEIAKAIEAALASRSARTAVTADDVVKGLLAEARLKGKGASHSARVQAWGLLARHLGMLTDHVKVSGPAPRPLAALSDEQLRALVSALPDEAPAGT